MVIAIDLRALMSGRISGVETYIQNLITHLLRINQSRRDPAQIILWLNAHKDHSKILSQFENFKYVTTKQTRIPSRILNISLALFRYPKIDKLIKKRTKLQPNLVFIPDIRPTPISNKTKKITVVHDLAFHHYPHFFSYKSRLWYKLIRPKRELKECTKIIAVSDATKQDLAKTYKIVTANIQTIHEGIRKDFCQNNDRSNLHKKYQLPNKYLLFLSTIEPRKNIKGLIKGYLQYLKENPASNLHLVLAGSPNKKLFQKTAISKHPRIHQLGFVPESHKEELYKKAHAFIYPSLHEGFGLPVLEAMKCGTPVITSDTSSLPEVAGDAALYINPHKPETIANAITQLNKPTIRQKLSRASLEQSQKFSWEKCAQQTYQLLIDSAANNLSER